MRTLHNEDDIKRQGVAIIIERELSGCMATFSLIYEREMSVTLKTNSGTATSIQVYAPDSTHNIDEIESFYNILQQEIDSIPRIRRFSSWGLQYKSWNHLYRVNTISNERGLRLLQFCSLNKCVLDLHNL